MAFMYRGMSSWAIQSSDLSVSIERTVPRAEYCVVGEDALDWMLVRGALESACAARGFAHATSTGMSSSAILGISEGNLTPEQPAALRHLDACGRDDSRTPKRGGLLALVRFHFYEDCVDSETSPHGHAAY